MTNVFKIDECVFFFFGFQENVDKPACLIIILLFGFASDSIFVFVFVFDLYLSHQKKIMDINNVNLRSKIN